MLGTAGGHEHVFQGFAADGYYITGCRAAWVSGSGEVARDADCMLSQSQVPCMLRVRRLSDGVSGPSYVSYRVLGEVVRSQLARVF